MTKPEETSRRCVERAAADIGAPAAWLRWLVTAALFDWLITRTLARSAIFMPKSAAVAAIYQSFTLLGNLASAVASLVAILMLGWIAWRGWRGRGPVALAPVLLAVLVLSLTFVFVPPAGWPAVVYHLLLVTATVLIARRTNAARLTGRTVARLVPAVALLSGNLFHLTHALYAALHWPGPPPLALTAFNLGELFVVLSPPALWWAHGRGAGRREWLLAALPALAFAAAHGLNPAMTGIIAIWSTGLTLVLPWPAYAASLWLAGVTVFASPRRGSPAGLALLLLAAGGYAAQSSTLAFLGLMALWLLAPPDEQPAVMQPGRQNSGKNLVRQRLLLFQKRI